MVKSILCSQCKVKIAGDECLFMSYKRVINGEEYAFCCQKCVEKFKAQKTAISRPKKQ